MGEEPGFTDASYRGSGDDRFRAWLTEPGNTDVHERLSRALFCVSVPAPGDASMAGVTDEARRLRAGAFATGHYWTYKPLTYELAADDSGWAALLVEHSTVDGATLVQTVADIQAGLAGADAGDRHLVRWQISFRHREGAFLTHDEGSSSLTFLSAAVEQRNLNNIAPVRDPLRLPTVRHKIVIQSGTEFDADTRHAPGSRKRPGQTRRKSLRIR